MTTFYSFFSSPYRWLLLVVVLAFSSCSTDKENKEDISSLNDISPIYDTLYVEGPIPLLVKEKGNDDYEYIVVNDVLQKIDIMSFQTPDTVIFKQIVNHIQKSFWDSFEGDWHLRCWFHGRDIFVIIYDSYNDAITIKFHHGHLYRYKDSEGESKDQLNTIQKIVEEYVKNEFYHWKPIVNETDSLHYWCCMYKF